jgi:hypothetical protein
MHNGKEEKSRTALGEDDSPQSWRARDEEHCHSTVAAVISSIIAESSCVGQVEGVVLW